MIVATDLDGVIANINIEMCRRYGEAGVEATEEGINVFKYEDCYGEPYPGWIADQFIDPAFWLNAIPYEDAWLYLNKWFSQGHDIYIVTARWEEEVTVRWLNEWDIPFNKIFCNVKKGMKYEVVKELEADFMIEDRPEEIYALAENDIVTFCMSRPYNLDVQDDTHIVTVSNFKDIDTILTDSGMIKEV